MASVDGDKSMNISSDILYDQPCDPCMYDGKQKDGEYYCKNCDEYLCHDCRDSHMRFKTTRTHTIVFGKDGVRGGDKTSQFKVICQCDQNLEVAVYCEIHDEVICNTCKTVKHRKCTTTKLHDKGVHYQVSEIQEVISKVQKLQKDIKTFLNGRNEDVQKFDSMVTQCREEIQTFTGQLKTYLDTLEENMISELQELAKRIRQDAEQHITTSTTTSNLLLTDSKILDDATKSGNPDMMLAADLKISKRLKEYQSMLDELRKERKSLTLTFDTNEKLVNIKTEVRKMGTLTVSSQENKNDKTTILDKEVESSREINTKTPGEKSTPWITGCVFMPDGQLVLCDRNNNSIKLLSSTLVMTEKLDVKSRPWDISVLDATTAVITIPATQQIQFINVVPSLKAGPVIQLDKRCYGISAVGEEMYVVCHDSPGNAEIRILDKTGQIKRRVPDNQNSISSLHSPCYLDVNETSTKVYISDWHRSAITCLTPDGKVLFCYQDNDLGKPNTVISDKEDNIIICGTNSRKIHVVTSNGKKRCILYTVRGRQVNNILSLAYRHTDNTLVIGLDDNELAVLKLRRKQ